MYDTKRLKCFRADGGLESESGLELGDLARGSLARSSEDKIGDIYLWSLDRTGVTGPRSPRPAATDSCTTLLQSCFATPAPILYRGELEFTHSLRASISPWLGIRANLQSVSFRHRHNDAGSYSTGRLTALLDTADDRFFSHQATKGIPTDGKKAHDIQ